MSKLWTPASSRRATLVKPTLPFVRDPRSLRPAKMHSVYSDDFDGAALDARWNTQGSLPSALALSGTSYGKFGISGNNQYIYCAAPSGDFTLTAAIQNATIAAPYASHMQGLMILDNSGNGVGLCPYNAPDEWILCSVAAGVYNSSFQQVGTVIGSAFMASFVTGHYRIIKSGTSYVAQIGDEVSGWSASSPSITGPATATRLAVGCWLYNAAKTLRVDWINLT